MTAPPLTSAEAAIALQAGGVVAYPTEGVWGLGCDPRNHGAVLRLLAIKQRSVDKGLILIGSHLDQLRPFLDIAALPTDRLAAVLATWPGPHTWVMPASSETPAWITGSHQGIAVRISAHAPVIELCNAFGGALVSTSANLSGQPAPRTRMGLDPAVLASLDGVLQGATGGRSAPSLIHDALTGTTLRN